MICDRQGSPLSGATPEAAARYDEAVEAFNIYSGDPIASLDRALELAPNFVMARVLKAHLLALATEPAATEEAKTLLRTLKEMRLDERETSHVVGLDKLLAGAWTEAAVAFDWHNVRYPHDMVALQSGHLIDFYRGNARNLRDRIARALPKWSPDMPGYAIVLGMYAFGLEEAGDYARAEAAGRHAVQLQPRDCWAHHAVAHVMEMQGRPEDGLGWMSAREAHWSGDANFFRVHNWWHRALFHLELGQGDAALALYDGPVRQGRSAVALDLVDASALLWRLHLTGCDVGDRWVELATTWDLHADGQTYPFNDWHAAMAYLGAGRDEEVARILAAQRAHATRSGEVARWASETGLTLVEGFVAFWRRDYWLAAERLHGARFIANSFGGSHAQRDIIDCTLAEAALRGGLHDLAEALAQERLALRPHCPMNRALLSRAREHGDHA